MLFFRSEEALNQWCQSTNNPRRPTATLPQLWQMAQHWYATRLTLEARRPKPDEIRHIFASIELTDPFWDPKADSFT
jgi:hypothetical protein